jgi:hypothetical protein
MVTFPTSTAFGKTKALREIGVRGTAAAVNTRRRQSCLFLPQTQTIRNKKFGNKKDVKIQGY